MGNAIIDGVKTGYKEGGIAVAICTLIILLGVVFGLYCGLAAIAMALWNGCLVAAIPILAEVGFWQMFGVMILFNILFGKTSSGSSK